MKFTQEEILDKALDALNLVKDQSPDFKERCLMMLGHPVGFKDPDPTTSDPTPGVCFGCKDPVTSTEVKDKILEIAPKSQILCYKCMATAIRMQKEITGSIPRMVHVPFHIKP